MTPLAITASTLTSALGAGRAATLAALRAQRTGLAPLRFESLPLATWTGEVDGVDDVALPAGTAEFECRNNRLEVAHDNGSSRFSFSETPRAEIEDLIRINWSNRTAVRGALAIWLVNPE